MRLLGVHIDEYKKEELWPLLQEKQILFTPNPEILLEARRNPKYKKALKAGTLMLPDGHGLLLASRLLEWPRALRLFALPFLMGLFLFRKGYFKKYIPELIHGSDFMNELVQWAAKEHKSVFFLGAGPGVAQNTAAYFLQKYPGLKAAGFSSGDPNEKTAELVSSAKPDVLFVAYGAPKQELWISQYQKQLNTIQIIMGVGGSFDFWSGQIRRAPKMMRKMGLEWLWRLFKEPRKRFKRIFKALVAFPLIVSFSSRASFQLSE